MITSLRFVAFSSLLFAAVGCSSTKGDELLTSFEPPADGQSVPADFWTKAAAVENTTAGGGSVWLVPFWLGVDSTELNDAKDGVRKIDVALFNPGLTVLPLLPFYVDVDYGGWSKNGKSESAGFTWTPFWAWGHTSEGSSVQLSATGVPILWGGVKIHSQEDDIDLRIRHYLWSLGPLFVGLDKGLGNSRVKGYQFYPVYLAGLGGLIWSSMDLNSDFGTVTAHGLLGGNLGYYKSTGFAPNKALENQNMLEMVKEGEDIGKILEKGKKSELMKKTDENGLVPGTELWLGGILWSAFTDHDAAGAEVNGRHGPLWTMFGYGKEKGESTVILFWYPF